VDRTSVAFVRRRDRAVEDDAWIRTFLHRAPLGFLATVGTGGQPFLNSNLFVYDEPRNTIFMHTARLSRTRQNIEQRERVCFSATEMGRLLPASTALDFSVEYASVVVFGRGSLVLDEADAIPALQLLLDKYAPHLEAGRDYRPPVSEEVKRTSVYRIEIEEWSAKRKAVADDFPGAFVYGEAGVFPRR
jgi:uncharacterized protein